MTETSTPKYALKTGTAFFERDLCYEDAGFDVKEEDNFRSAGRYIPTWPTYNEALEAGKKIYQDRWAVKFNVVQL
jgi:hypothetical protein